MKPSFIFLPVSQAYELSTLSGADGLISPLCRCPSDRHFIVALAQRAFLQGSTREQEGEES